MDPNHHSQLFKVGSAQVSRFEDIRLITGNGKYSSDWNAPDQLHAVRQALEKAGLKAENAELVMKPKTIVSVAPKDAVSVMGLIDALEELDDVQQVYSNLEFSEEAVAQYAAQAA